jgi:peroxiredoxin
LRAERRKSGGTNGAEQPKQESERTVRMPLSPGEPAPWFTAPTPSNPEYVFDTVAGRFVLLAFLPALDAAAAGAALKALSNYQRLFDDRRLSAFVVVRDPAMAATLRDMPGLRWFLDFDGAVSRLYDALGEDGAERPSGCCSIRRCGLSGMWRWASPRGYSTSWPGCPIRAVMREPRCTRRC